METKVAKPSSLLFYAPFNATKGKNIPRHEIHKRTDIILDNGSEGRGH